MATVTSSRFMPRSTTSLAMGPLRTRSTPGVSVSASPRSRAGVSRTSRGSSVSVSGRFPLFTSLSSSTTTGASSANAGHAASAAASSAGRTTPSLNIFDTSMKANECGAPRRSPPRAQHDR